MGKKSDGAQETPQQAAMVEKAMQQMLDYKSRWLPLQQRMAAQITDLGKSDSSVRKVAQGRASTETAAKFGQARSAMEKSLGLAGQGPGSAKFKLASTGMAGDQATSTGMGTFATDAAVDNAYIQGLGTLAAIGRGEKAGALQGASNIAAMSGRQAAQDAQLALADRMGNAQLAGQVAGAGMSAMMRPSVPQAGGLMTDTNGMFTPSLGDGTSQLSW